MSDKEPRASAEDVARLVERLRKFAGGNEMHYAAEAADALTRLVAERDANAGDAERYRVVRNRMSVNEVHRLADMDVREWDAMVEAALARAALHSGGSPD